MSRGTSGVLECIHGSAIRVLAPNLWRRREADLQATLADLHAEARSKGGLAAAITLVMRECRVLVTELLRACRQAIIGGLGSDLRYAIRVLLQRPGATAVMVLTMALGIAVNVTVFRAVQQAILQPLPFDEPERIAILWDYDLERGRNAVGISTALAFDTYRNGGGALAEFAASRNGTLTLTGLERPLSPLKTFMTPSLHALFGVAPILGRTFTSEDAALGAAPVAMLSHELWQQLGGDPSIVGQPLELDGADSTIVGVMPAGFRFPLGNNPPLLWAPLQVEDWSERNTRNLFVFARLNEHISYEQFGSAMDELGASLAATYPDSFGGRGVRVDALQDRAFGPARVPLLVLMGAVGFVLLIACVNIANIQLARALGRTRELGLRIAIGASQTRIVRQLMVEALLVATAGGGLGLLAVLWTGPFVDRFMPPWASNEFYSTGLANTQVVIFTAFATIGTALIFGLAPALAVARGARNDATMRTSTEGRTGRRLRRGLTIAEVAISLVLLAGTGLMVRSLVSLRALDPGITTERLTVMRTGVRGDEYSVPERRAAHYRDVVARLNELPGVESATAGDRLPPTGLGASVAFTVSNGAAVDHGHEPRIGIRSVTPGYFATLKIEVISGIPFGHETDLAGEPVAVINETARRRFWPEADPVGSTITLLDDATPRRIVAVVGDVRTWGVPPETPPMLFLPHEQRAAATMTLAVRTEPGAAVSVEAMQKIILDAEPRSPIYNVTTMDQRIEDANRSVTGIAELLGWFAMLALALVTIGIYAIMSQTVRERFREFGIRMALGAPAKSMLRLVVRDALRIAAWGSAVGLVGALTLGRVLTGLLYDVAPHDPVTMGAVLLGMAAVVVTASAVPGLRAARTNPADTLRQD